MPSLCTVHSTCRKQAWLWAQGDSFRTRPDNSRTDIKSGVDDVVSHMQRSSSLKRSVLKSRQEYEVDLDDDSVSHIAVIMLMSCQFFTAVWRDLIVIFAV